MDSQALPSFESKENASTYDLLAPTYDHRYLTRAIMTWNFGILKTLQDALFRVGTILDLGCGTGAGAQAIRTLSPSTTVGLDISSGMTLQASSHYSHVIVADMRRMPLFNLNFDCAVCGFDTLNHLSPAALDTLLETLVADRIAQYLCCDFITNTTIDWLLEMHPGKAQFDGSSLRTWHSIPSPQALSLPLMHYPIDASSIVSKVRRLGGSVVNFRKMSLPIPEYLPGQYVALFDLQTGERKSKS